MGHVLTSAVSGTGGSKVSPQWEGLVRKRTCSWPLRPAGSSDLVPLSEQVHSHFRRYEVEYLQFAFRWMNNLLMRELPLRCTIRLWDTYQVWRDPSLSQLSP